MWAFIRVTFVLALITAYAASGSLEKLSSGRLRHPIRKGCKYPPIQMIWSRLWKKSRSILAAPNKLVKGPVARRVISPGWRAADFAKNSAAAVPFSPRCPAPQYYGMSFLWSWLSCWRVDLFTSSILLLPNVVVVPSNSIFDWPNRYSRVRPSSISFRGNPNVLSLSKITFMGWQAYISIFH